MAFIREAPYLDKVEAVRAYWAALEEQRDEWVVACVGTEVPVIRNGHWELRVFNPAIGLSGWLDLDTDIVDVDQVRDPVGNLSGHRVN